MKALVYHGNEEVAVEERPKPVIGAQSDAIVRVTSAGICGSDLHIYHGDIPDTHDGDVLGHEFTGVVEEIGREVTSVRPGDRVVVACFISCGTCWFCEQGLFSLCDASNPNPVMQEMYGQHVAAAYGYSHLMGGVDGGQAEYVRVPFADVGCFKLPPQINDDQAVLLADNLGTGWMAAEMAEVSPGDTVAVFGCGSVGLLAMKSARFKGAERIIAIDHFPYRLDLARDRFHAETINFDTSDPVKTIRELTHGRGPDACIEAAGFRFARTLRHEIQKTLRLETDAVDSLSDAIRSVRKGGRLSVVGDFIGFANQFPIGAMMEKGLTVRGGQVQAQKYIPKIMGLVERGELDPTFVVTHHTPLEEASTAYRMFDKREDGVIKVVLRAAA